ncbi:GntR family transcriptional regulator [Kineococcus sp. SYSU DK006]|uniref:GntR family transcriptional regulator n=1 Tax=Kineococcus sp. SYSU DK006 TaxID=3383127 RepID=UPI003D7D6DC6
MLITIDAAAEEPLFAQIADSVRAAALHGQVHPGERLPAARELAASLGINVHTVLHAYQLLRDEGLIELRRGRGAVLTSAAVPAAASAAGTGTDVSALAQAAAHLVDEARRLGVGRESLLTLVKEVYS